MSHFRRLPNPSHRNLFRSLSCSTDPPFAWGQITQHRCFNGPVFHQQNYIKDALLLATLTQDIAH